MCGIAGIWEIYENRISKSQVICFVESLAHRGPDGQGIYKDSEECLYLGHRRLAILDISEKGAQPMTFGDGRFWVVFNGEIYNFLELKKELQEKGYGFHTDSDTEVLLASFIEWGEECQLKFNGMWAFAIWDSRKKALFLSRDRFGVKPLYFTYDEKRFAFASELKAFTNLPQFRIEFDNQVLAKVLLDGNSSESTEHSWIKGIQRLPGGHSLVFRKGKGILIHQWWNTLDHLPSIPERWEDQVSQFHSLFLDACRIRSRSDVPTATALSGGLDSSSVLAALFHLRERTSIGKEERFPKEWRYVFSALFPQTSQDEFPFIQQMIEHTKTIPFYSELLPQMLKENLDKVLYDLEEIFDLPIGPWILYKNLRAQGMVISIDGHGADELLGGYAHHVEAYMQGSLFPKLNFARVSELNTLLRCMYPEGSPFGKLSALSFAKKTMIGMVDHFSPAVHTFLKKWYTKAKSPEERITNWLQSSPKRHEYGKKVKEDDRFRKWGALNKILYLDFHERTLPTILRNFDRCSMAHGVEIRAPFMDWRLVTYAFALPESAKVGGGMTKRILREAMRGLLPESIRTRTSKVGFASPMIEWLRGDLKNFILDEVYSHSFQTCSLWDGPQILRVVKNAYQNKNEAVFRSVWEFVQANRLMQSFHSQSRMNVC